jgi:hypothetical protein
MGWWQFQKAAGSHTRPRVPLSRKLWCLTAIAVAASLPAVAWKPPIQASLPDIGQFDRVEEDWELVIGEPDPESCAPQIFNVLTPTIERISNYAVLEINHSTQPSFSEGGLQMQRWIGESFRDMRTSTAPGLLAVPHETIRYTMAMALNNYTITFSVLNGTSTAWGSFGGSGMTMSSSTTLSNLNEYSADTSAEYAQIGYAAHRVERFRLLCVRYYRDGELIYTDSTAKQVHPVVVAQ